MRRQHRVLILLACAVSIVPVGCGGDSAISDEASALLQAQVRDARVAASQGNIDDAIARLEAVAQQLGTLRDRELLTAERADDIDAAIDDVQFALAASATTTSTETTTTDAPTTEATSEPTEPTDTTESSTTTTTEAPVTTTTETTVPQDGGDGGNGAQGRGHGRGNDDDGHDED